MRTYQIELLNPKAKKLLDELANLKLIKVQEMPSPKQELATLLSKFRKKTDKAPTLEEITKEVESVREKRYAKRNKN
jgi:hypothetical protein